MYFALFAEIVASFQLQRSLQALYLPFEPLLYPLGYSCMPKALNGLYAKIRALYAWFVILHNITAILFIYTIHIHITHIFSFLLNSFVHSKHIHYAVVFNILHTYALYIHFVCVLYKHIAHTYFVCICIVYIICVSVTHTKLLHTHLTYSLHNSIIWAYS